MAPAPRATSATPDERPEPQTEGSVAVSPEAVPPATSSEPNAQESVTTAARSTEPTLPDDARTELAMMKRIQVALRDADFSTVLTLCTQHARTWPHGVFEQEREGARVIAHCGADSDDAVRRVKRFLTAHPHAPVAMRVRDACAAQLLKRSTTAPR